MIVPPIGGLGTELAAGAAQGLSQNAATGATTGVAPLETSGQTGGTPNFGAALTEAIGSLEAGQQSSDAASQALATGTVSDPAAAVTTVEDAALEMQLAAQIRTKATEAIQTIFQTQV